MTREEREVLKKSLTLTNEEIAENAREWEVGDEVFKCVLDDVCEDMEREPEVAARLSFYHKTQYLVEQSYRKGLLAGLYFFNEALKKTLNEIEVTR